MDHSRYFLEIKYKGSPYAGWQIQPNALTVQEVVQTALKKILKKEISVTGCGRTDSGVHASQFFLHFDSESISDASHFLFKMNSILENSIAALRLIKVHPEAHTRFDAVSRTYNYFIHFEKDPFLNSISYKYNQSKQPSKEKLQEAAALLLNYEAYFPFCKSKSEVDNYRCQLTESEWTFNDNGQFVFVITANRFLRGMVRMVVGMCINVSIGKLTIEEVKSAMDNQVLLPHPWSVPAEGLFLTNVKYSYI